MCGWVFFVAVGTFFLFYTQPTLATLGVFSDYEERKNASKEVMLQRRLSFWSAFGRGATAQASTEPAEPPGQRRRLNIFRKCVLPRYSEGVLVVSVWSAYA